MTELEIEELERKITGSDSVIEEEATSVEALPDHVGEDVRNALLEMGAEEQADSLDEEEGAIVMEIAEVIERGRKDKVLSKFKIRSITKTNELYYARAVVGTNRLVVKIEKVAWRGKPRWNRRLQNKIKELRKNLCQLEASKDKNIGNFRHWERLESKYSIRAKRLNVNIEELTEDYYYCSKS